MSFLVQGDDSGLLQNMQWTVTGMWSAIADIIEILCCRILRLQLFNLCIGFLVFSKQKEERKKKWKECFMQHHGRLYHRSLR